MIYNDIWAIIVQKASKTYINFKNLFKFDINLIQKIINKINWYFAIFLPFFKYFIIIQNTWLSQFIFSKFFEKLILAFKAVFAFKLEMDAGFAFMFGKLS